MAITISLAIAVNDHEGMRKKTGDIISARGGLWEWGSEERKRYLIIDLRVPDKVAQWRDRFKSGWYLDGLWEQQWTEDGDPIPRLKSGKRRLNIPPSVIQNKAPGLFSQVNWSRVRDETDDYQPARDNGYIFDITGNRAGWVFDKIKNRLMTQQEFDTDLAGENGII